MKKLLFVYNPRSGKGQINIHLPEIIDIFTKGDYSVTAHPTQSQNDAYRTIKEYASEYELVVCSGGDGTMNETIKGILDGGHHVPVGYIPAGTMNDFASSLGIPRHMPDAAINIIRGKPHFVDIGAFNDKYFTYVAAFGAFTKVSYATDQQLKNTLGPLAYMIEALKNSDLDQKYTLTIKCNGQTITDEFIFGMVANSFSVGGIRGLTGKDVSLNDGIVEGIFIRKPSTLAETQKIINALITHDYSSDFIFYFKSDDFSIHTKSSVPWTLDGEYGGDSKDISLCVLHNVLQIITTANNTTVQ